MGQPKRCEDASVRRLRDGPPEGGRPADAGAGHAHELVAHAERKPVDGRDRPGRHRTRPDDAVCRSGL
ncbi:hypothetical protein G6F31_020503 [Rhizopus arrhizus]|nr:hypothetical protein G6F31_020503 [Rhizopus arrhizus]